MIRQFGYDYITSADAGARYHYDQGHIETLARLGKVCSLKKQGVVYVRLVDIHDYAAKRLAARIAGQLKKALAK